MNERSIQIYCVRLLAVATVFIVLALSPQYADAQCAIEYADIYESGDSVWAWSGLADLYSYNNGSCNPGWWDFMHNYDVGVSIISPSNRQGSGQAQSSAYGGGG